MTTQNNSNELSLYYLIDKDNKVRFSAFLSQEQVDEENRNSEGYATWVLCDSTKQKEYEFLPCYKHLHSIDAHTQYQFIEYVVPLMFVPYLLDGSALDFSNCRQTIALKDIFRNYYQKIVIDTFLAEVTANANRNYPNYSWHWERKNDESYMTYNHDVSSGYKSVECCDLLFVGIPIGEVDKTPIDE